MEKKGEKRRFYIVYIIFFLIVGTLLISTASAGWFDWVKKITGKATSTFGLNITVGGPQIITVYNSSAWTPVVDTASTLTINFTVYSASGWNNLNITSARINITRTGETARENLTCQRTATWSTYYANYSCQIAVWYWDANGTWNIAARIQDNQSNMALNTTVVQFVPLLTGFAAAPDILLWPGLAPGATNQTSNNDPLLFNNTGNAPFVNISINATNLRGETTSSLALWAGNFSAYYSSGGESCIGAACLECAGTKMVNKSYYTQVTTANITKGNYTMNNNITGQEQLWFCLRYAGTELTTQAYSTANESNWVIEVNQ